MRSSAALARPPGSARSAQAGFTALAARLGLALASDLDRLTVVPASDLAPSGAAPSVPVAVVAPVAAVVAQPAPTWHGQVTPPRLPSVTPWAGGG